MCDIFKCYIPSKNVLSVNPYGGVVIVCLWSSPEKIYQLLLDRHKTSVAAIGGLYGGGLNILLRNLLYNPQIDTVLIFGKELGEGSDHLCAYFEDKITYTNELVKYKTENGQILEQKKIYINGSSSNYVIDDYITPDKFIFKPICRIISTDGINNHKEDLFTYLDTYCSKNQVAERIEAPMVTPVTEYYPSNTFNHQICKDNIFDVWKEILFSVYRFGKHIELRNSKIRKELLNVKAVINKPMVSDIDKTILHHYGLSKQDLEEYTNSLFSCELTQDQTYSYGNRINAYFNINGLDQVVEDMSISGDRRRNYITLWDNKRDMCSDHGRPCMLSLFFRKINNQMSLTVTFRSHNSAKAWIKNAYGLARMLEIITKKTNTDLGKLTLISHSLTLDPNNINQILDYIEEYKDNYPQIVLDPNGYIKISVDIVNQKLVLEHYDPDNNLLDVYRDTRPSDIQYELNKNKVISNIGHAMYIGNQLEKAYLCMINNKEYIQDKQSVRWL